jgi:microcystin-dependent protein
MKEKTNKDAMVETTESGISTGQVPIGTIVAFILDKSYLPSGWLLCDGNAVDSNKYPEAVNNYQITATPVLNGLVLLGAGSDYPLKSNGGEAMITLTIDQMPEHGHKIDFYDWSTSQGGGSGHASRLNNVQSIAYTQSSGGGKAHNNIQPYYAVNYIIYVGKPV